MELIGRFFDYRDYLKSELGRRGESNKQYSLRAFARDLGMAPQNLSPVLSGKKNISPELAIEIARKLGLNSEELSYFHDLVELAVAKSESLKDVIRYRLARYEANRPYLLLREDVFRVISDWHHYAILEATFLTDFRPEPVWLSEKLGISVTEARQALERLLKLNLLARDGKSLVKTDTNLTTTHDVPSAAVKKFTAQLLTKAAQALEQQPIEERDFGTITMAIDPARLPEAKNRIRKFRRDLMKFLEGGDRREIYALCTQLMRLSKKRRSI